MAASGRPTYTFTARRQMAESGVTEREVEIVLRHPTARRRDPRGNDIVFGRIHGRQLRLVIAKDSSPPMIITVVD